MKPVILMYHSVVKSDPADPYGISIKEFKEQISWLDDQGYQFVSLANLVKSIREDVYSKGGKQVVLTFDDGYRDFLDYAVPVLLERRLPATVFLATDMLGKTAGWSNSNNQVQLMTEDEVRQVRKIDGISLGSHTLTHTDITTLNEDELERQLVASKTKLTDLGETFHAFSYPWGKYAGREVIAVKTADYQCAVAIEGLLNFSKVDPFRLGRVTIRRDMGINSFIHIVSRSTMREKIIAHTQSLMLRMRR